MFVLAGAPLILLAVIALLFLQWRRPLRVPRFSLLRRVARNYLFSVPALVALRSEAARVENT